MALSIKTVEADRLARELAAATSESITEAVTIALRERLDRVRDRQRLDIAHQLDRLMTEYTGLTQIDNRTADEIIGYDEHGLPA